MSTANEERHPRGRDARTSGTRLKAVDVRAARRRVVGTGLDLGSGVCRHGIFELQRQLVLLEADRPARESHQSPAGQLSLVVEGHGFLPAAKRGMSALLLDHLARSVVGQLPTHDLRGDGRSQARLVRDLREAIVEAQERTRGAIAEEGRASASLLFTNEHFFWVARCGAGAVFLSRAGYTELLTAGTGADDDENPIDVLGAPLQPGDTFLLASRAVAGALEVDLLGRALRTIDEDDESVAETARSLGDAALSAGIEEGALVIARR